MKRLIATAASLLICGSALAQTPPSISTGSGAGPSVGVQHGQHGGPQSAEGIGVLVFRGSPSSGTAGSGAAGVNGLGFTDGRLTFQGAAGQATLDALRAQGSWSLSAGGGSGSGDNLRVRVEADGRLVLVGVSGATRPLEVLGTQTTLDGSAAILLRAAGTAGIEAGPQGAGANIGGELFAGARAEGSGNFTIPLLLVDLEIRVGGSANAGIGASASAGAEFRNGRVRVHADAGLTVGVGATGGISVGVGPGSIFRPGTRFQLPEAERRRLDRLSQMTAPPPPPPPPPREPTAFELQQRRLEQMTAPTPLPSLPWAPSRPRLFEPDTSMTGPSRGANPFRFDDSRPRPFIGGGMDSSMTGNGGAGLRR